MKATITAIFVVAITVLFIVPSQSYAQVLKGDTMYVYALPPGNLNEVIDSDTNATGQRNPNRVYVLQQTGPLDTVYFMSAQVSNSYNLTIIGKKNPVTGHLPVIAPFPNISGSYPSLLFREYGGTTTFKNLYFCLWRPDTTQGSRVFNPKSDSVRIIMDNDVVDGNWANVFLIQSSDLEVYITNCLFRDVHKNNSGSVVVGVNGNRDIDTVEFVNNSFVGGAPYSNGGFTGHLIVNHNTFFYAAGSPFGFPEVSNAVITNNIFYAQCAMGTDSAEIGNATKSGAGGAVPGNYAVFGFDSLTALTNPPHSLTEMDRNIVLKNNIYAWPQQLYTYWKAVRDTSTTPGLITNPIFMSPLDSMMFSDHTSWPGLQMANNDSTDPVFNSTLVSLSAQAMINWVNTVWINKTTTSTQIAYPTLLPSNAETNIQSGWAKGNGYPVPEDLTYSDKTLLTAGTDSKPLGDLNWFKNITDVQKIPNAIPNKFSLSQNYPNPFNPSTVIKYSITKSGIVSLAIYNILGQKVATLFNGFQKAGSYKANFNASKLASGVYLYRLQSNGASITKKMLLLK